MKLDASIVRNCPQHGAHVSNVCPICGSSGKVLETRKFCLICKTFVDEPHKHSSGVDKESKLHAQIIKFCDAQWPRWKYIHSRMDKASTTEKGVPDFVILAPRLVLFFECKAKGGKLSEDQRDWKHEAKNLSHEVDTVYCFEDFLSVLRDLNLIK